VASTMQKMVKNARITNGIVSDLDSSFIPVS
jgi:hypothetical protein